MIEEISVVLPSLDEEESLPDLVNEIISEFEEKAIAYEIIIVDDGSKVHVDQLFDKYKSVKVIRNRFTKGQSNSLLSGIKNSNYDYICTLDADGQNPPSEIFKLISEFDNDFDNLDVVAGYRENRKDNLFRTIYSKIANIIIRFITNSKSLDLGCGLKVFKKSLMEDINFNGDIHRMLVPLFEYRNFKLKQVPVQHNERVYGKTKYGFGRFMAVVIDGLLLYLTDGFIKSSRYALGKLSFFFGAISIILFSIALYQKINLSIFVHRNPIFLIGLTALFISIQMLLTSLISFFVENRK